MNRCQNCDAAWATTRAADKARIEAEKELSAHRTSAKRDRFLKRLSQCVKEYPQPPREPVEAFLVWVEARIRTMEAEDAAAREAAKT